MVSKLLTALCSGFFFCGSVFAQQPGQVKILFDATHAETSGNGDWAIDADQTNLGWNSTGGYTCTSCSNKSNPQQYPTPSQTLITSSTPETFWQGALSHWATDCVKKGYWVESLPFGKMITYGNSNNTQDLSKYNIFVVDEPNTLLTSAEKAAIVNFVQNGGSLFMISDHTGSDRNGDGYDSPVIWNDFLTNNGVANNAFGFTFALEDFNSTSVTNLATSSSDSIIHGSYGTVAKVQWSSGTCMTKNPAQNPYVKGHIWKNSKGQSDTAVMCLTSRYGCGKIAAISDSSPPDDSTGNPNLTSGQYNGYMTDAGGNHRPWLMNTMIWLAENSCASSGINLMSDEKNINLYPNPASGAIFLDMPENLNGAAITVVDINGKQLLATLHKINGNCELNVSSLENGVYFCRISTDAGTVTKKIIIAK